MRTFFYLFLIGILGSAYANVNYDENREKIQSLFNNKNSIIGLEFILAAPTDSKIESKWGHALLRFVDNDNNWANDPVLSFAANVTDKKMSQWKGLTGGYEVIPELSSLGEFWKYYTKAEGRSIQRYPLLLERKNLTYFIDELSKWNEDQTYFGKYYFTSNNCTTLIGDILTRSGVVSFNRFNSRPSHFPKWLQRNLIAPYPAIEALNPLLALRKLHTILGIGLADFQRGKNWPENSFELISSEFTIQEMRVLRDHLLLMPQEVREKLNSHLPQIQLTSYQEILNMNSLDHSFYDLTKSPKIKTLPTYFFAIKNFELNRLGLGVTTVSGSSGSIKRNNKRQKLRRFQQRSPQFLFFENKEKK